MAHMKKIILIAIALIFIGTIVGIYAIACLIENTAKEPKNKQKIKNIPIPNEERLYELGPI